MNKISDIKIEHNSFIALHVQLHSQLRHLIHSGNWAYGSLIPPENQLASHLRISRTTVRLALQRAELEGLIERVAGKGTFVTFSERTPDTRLIAFVTCGFDNEYHLFLLNGAESEARANGYRIIFSKLNDCYEEAELLKRLSEEKVAGVVLWPHPNPELSPEENAQIYEKIGLPMVFMDRDVAGVKCDCVTSDNYNGAYGLVNHLIEMGHQQIAFLSHRRTELLTARERYRAYCDAMRAAGLTPRELWLMGEPGAEISATEVFRASNQLRSPKIQTIKNYLENDPVTAIFALNDFVAVLAMHAAKALHLSVPQQLSIAGFDDIDLAAYLEVPLTTVTQDPFMIGKRATRRLIDRLEGYSGPVECEVIPTQLRVRSSTAVPMLTEGR